MERPALIERLLKGIENERCIGGAADPPADDVSGKHVDYEGDMDKDLPG